MKIKYHYYRARVSQHEQLNPGHLDAGTLKSEAVLRTINNVVNISNYVSIELDSTIAHVDRRCEYGSRQSDQANEGKIATFNDTEPELLTSDIAFLMEQTFPNCISWCYRWRFSEVKEQTLKYSD